MSSGGSITHWIHEVRVGDSRAAAALWDRYFPQLVRLAKKKLRGLPGQIADEEDIALSAMNRFYQAAEEGRYPELADRDGLWRLLFQITVRRATDLRRSENRQRRRGDRGRSRTESNPTRGQAEPSSVSQLPDDTLSPEMEAVMGDECQRLFAELQDGELQAIAAAKMEGASNEEIAAQLKCSQRTVERRLRLIRDKWKRVWSEEKNERGYGSEAEGEGGK